MRAKYESRLRRIESSIGGNRLCTFTEEESETINAICRRYLGRDPTREDIRAKNGPLYEISDDELVGITDCVRAASRRGVRG